MLIEGSTFYLSPQPRHYGTRELDDLLVGMVNDGIVSADKLKVLAQRISKLEQRDRNSGDQS